MENTETDPIEVALTKWKGLTLTKKIFTVVILVIATLFTFIIIASLNSARSTSLGLSMMDSSGYSSGLSVPSYAPTQELARNGMYYEDSYVTGNDAEAFETKDYTVRYETSSFINTCDTIDSLKPRPNVIFLSASRGDYSCQYQFKVTNNEVKEVLTILKSLNPKDLTERTNSIKKQLENSLTQKDILTQNLVSTESILNDAIAAYDTLLATAVDTRNSDALAKAVRDKIELIDQLKQRRENTGQQIDWLNKSLAEQQDRLDYTYFSVSVSKQTYFDSKSITASWQFAVKRMITSANEVLQKLSVGLVSFILYIALYAVYLIIVMLIAKVSWRTIRRIWRS